MNVIYERFKKKQQAVAWPPLAVCAASLVTPFRDLILCALVIHFGAVT